MKSEENNENDKDLITTESQVEINKDSNIKISSTFNESIALESAKAKKKKCTFPTAYSILLIIELVVFILTYIIKKGLNIKIPLESFLKGYISDPISIPNTYHTIDEGITNPLKVITYPIKGCIDSAYIAYFLLVMGGNLNILIEMKSLSSGMAALSRITKGREFLLLILVFIIIAIGGTTFGMAEEVLPFYPILMPIFLKSGFDGILGMAPLFMGSLVLLKV